jgi:CheY-like chemotaxis protein/anti-sigma regulatory factor (Ser/Thr protein kinase)
MEDLDGEAREMAATIQRSGQLLLTVLNDVLDGGSFYEGRPRIEPAVFDPAQIIRHCVELVRPLARQKNLDLRFVCPPEMGSRLEGDPVRLQQVFINLLSNAVKFTERGSITVAARVAESANSQTIAFSVMDTGIGMDEQAQQSLFERFEQVHRPMASDAAGTGLGLAISKRLVEAMGGKIVCRSKPGEGSRFEFTLRFPVMEEAAASDAKAGRVTAGTEGDASSVPHAAKVRALVAEDNPVNQNILTRMLERLNCETQVAANGAEALKACCHDRFDVIFMDCDMPVLNGLDATRRIRQLPEFSDVPIIAATAHALPANLTACRAAGMSDILTKPLTIAGLRAALERWAGRGSRVAAAEGSR